MSSSETWTARRAEGFALAATAQADRGATLALPGLAADVVEAAAASALALTALGRESRRHWLQTVLGPETRTQRPIVADKLPARALGLLAGSVERELGRAWLARAPRPRPGWSAERRFVAWLTELASRTRNERREPAR